MQTADIRHRLELSGLPTAYRMFPEGDAPALPFVVWYIDSERNFAADDTNYHNIKHLTVELYTAFKDLEAEEKVEAILNDIGVWTKTDVYIDTEKCYQITYNMEV